MEQTHFTDDSALVSEYSIMQDENLFPHRNRAQFAMLPFISDKVRQSDKKRFINVFEAGFGSGFTTKLLLGVDPRICVTAVDYSEEMFKQGIVTLEQLASQNGGKVETHNNVAFYSDKGQKRVEYLHMGLEESLDQVFNKPRFDGFASGYCLHSFTPEQRENIFRGISRILVPGGFYANGDRYAYDDEQEHQKALQENNKGYEVLLEAGLPHLYKEWIEHSAQDDTHRFTHAEQQRLLETNGFTKGKMIFRDCLAATFVAQKLDR